MKQSEVDLMKKQFPTPPSMNWYKSIAIPCSWRIVHGRLSGKRVLDVGCASGWIAYLAQEEGASVLATDIFDTMINKEIIPFQIADKENLPFDSNNFDFVITANVLHHGNLDLTVKEAYRVLKPGGEFVSFQEPCIPNDINEKEYLEKNLKSELDSGIDERRPNLIEYKRSFSMFSQITLYEMKELVMGNIKQPFLKSLTVDSFDGGIAIHAIK